MTYRDDLEAAHARIAALEAEVAAQRGRAEEARRDGAEQEGERAGMAEEIKQLRAVVEERRALLGQLRAERDQLAQRVRVLESERAGFGGSARALPTLWERNRSFAPVAYGKVVDVACPACRAIGLESQMIREDGPGSAPATDLRFERVSCPSCLFTGALRAR
jgi:hypothetical protein